ncbi:MAG: GGDEF domain-containing protein [Clostridium sp.]
MNGSIKDKTNRKRVIIALSILIVCLSMFMYWYIKNVSNLLEDETKGYLNDISLQRSATFSTKVNTRLDILLDISRSPVLHEKISFKDKLDYLAQKEEYKDYIRLGITDRNGVYKSTDGHVLNLSKEEGYRIAMKGKPYISEPFADKVSGIGIIVFYVPIIENNRVIGVITASKDVPSLCKTLFEPFFGEAGHSFVVNGTGKVIFQEKGQYNIVSVDQLRVIQDDNEVGYHSLIVSGDRKATKVRYNGEELYAIHSKIEGVSDWYIVNTAPVSVIAEKTTMILRSSVVMTCIILGAFALLISYIYFSYKHNEKKYEDLAYVDRITGIRNHYGFLRDGEALLKKRSGTYAMIYFDINNFKVTNDIFGYKFGDEILNNIAQILRQMFGQNQVYARFSNDLFGILIRISGKSDTTIVPKYDYNHIIGHDKETRNTEYTDIDMYLIGIVAEIEHRIKNFAIETKPHVDLLMSYGVYVVTSPLEEVSTISNKANMARKTVKGQYQRRLAFFNDSIRDNLVEEKNLEGEIIKALEHNQFEVYYQPKYKLSTNELVGAEALIRWIHPEKGMINPGKFIPVAEKTGLIIPIGRWVLNSVCEKINEWNNLKYDVVPISVNFSRAEMYQTDFIKSTKETIRRSDIDPKYIEIELTESAALNDVDFAKNTIMGFRDLGIKVSIDDFGTGYSCLSYLKSMPIDILKIDRSFIVDIEENDKSKNVLKAIVELAKSLNLDVVSEGVETHNQTEFLKQVGCDMVQGYAFNRPMPVKDFEELIKTIEFKLDSDSKDLMFIP